MFVYSLPRPFSLLALVMAALALSAALLPASTVGTLYSEEGPVESLAVLVWLVLAALLLWWRRPPLLSIAWAVVAAVLALREAGLPPVLFPSGKRLLTVAYYLDPSVALGNRMLGGVLVLGSLACLGYGIGATGWRMWRRRAWREPLIGVMLVAAGALLLGQIFEALPDWLESISSQPAPQLVAGICLALEEGLELLCPSMLAYAVWRGKGMSLG